MKKCLVSIKGFQTFDNDNDCIEMVADGKFQYDVEKTVAVYYESQTVCNDVRVLLKFYPNDKLIIERSGALQSTMIIQKGKRYCDFYTTAQGKLCMGVYGESIHSELNENGGSIFCEYQLDIDGKIVSRNRIEVLLKEV